MVKSVLVDNTTIEAGRALVDFLLQTDFQLEVALWERQESGKARLILATPLVHQHGRLVAYDRLRSLVERSHLSESTQAVLDAVSLRSPSDGIITVLAMGSGDTPVPLNRMLEDESVGGVWVDGLYVYHFAPKTFYVDEDSEELS